jgi:hypothetical protein
MPSAKHRAMPCAAAATALFVFLLSSSPMPTAAVDGLFPDVANLARQKKATITLASGDSKVVTEITDSNSNSASSFTTDADTILTIDLGAEVEIFQTYVTFSSARPSSAVIERSIDGGDSWQALQYFSDDCKDDFGMTVRCHRFNRLSRFVRLKFTCACA